MPITTNLSQSPYFDTFDPKDTYYQVLFKPSISVQTRELNELQSILQNQIEKFGDNIFKKGTIIDGCNFVFFDNYPYVKINDNQLNGQTAIPSNYVGYFAKNSSNLQSYIINYQDGFESTIPDLKTVYVTYINSGNGGNETSYAPGQTLTIFDSNNGLHSVSIINGGSNFSNNDSVYFVSALAVNVSTSNTFSNNETITQAVTGARATVVEANTTAIPGTLLLKIKPLNTDVANTSGNSAIWEFSFGDDYPITGGTTSSVATVMGGIGTNAKADILTDGAGKVINVRMLAAGSGYYVPPYTVIKPTNAGANINDLNLQALNYLTQVTVAAAADSVGNGYAFGVTEGIVYQKGYFVDVAPQTVVVEKYSKFPDQIAIGFDTIEEIINSDIDPDLLDNSLGEPNQSAPGADRLKLTPQLKVMTVDDADANTQFFSIVQFSEGKPYKQNVSTVYNVIQDQISAGISDVAGNFVLDRFLVTSRSPGDSTLEGNTVSIVIDPGEAYVSGYKVQTTANFVINDSKGDNYRTKTNQNISLVYGDYIKVNQLAGVFQFSTGDSIDLYDMAVQYLSNSAMVAAGSISPVGTKIGTARIRSLVNVTGDVGNPSSQYYLYLFNITMNTGKNFNSVKSVYYNGTNYKGIADTVLEPDATTNSNITKLYDVNIDGLLFPTGATTTKNANNVNYTYRTINQTLSVSNSGITSISLTGNPNEYFPYSGNLNSVQMRDLIMLPTGNNLFYTNTIAGTLNVNGSSVNVVGTTTTFINDLQAGDYIRIFSNTTQDTIRKVTSVVNNSFITLDSNPGFANAAAVAYRAFPKNVPVPLGNRTGFSANVNANGNILYINLGSSLSGTTSVNTAISYNVNRQNITQATKTPNRNLFVKIQLSNNAGNTVGPWCLGVPDIFRLNKVYYGDATVNVNSTDITSSFYIDHNQTVNYYDHGFLFQKPGGGVNLQSNGYMLVSFDAFTTTNPGYASVVSYVSANATQRALVDSQPLSNLSSTVNTLEIPEVFSFKGEYYDLIDNFDFRPEIQATANLTSNPTNATLNPPNTISFGNTADPANDKKFPLPNSLMRADIEYYVARTDSITVSKDGQIKIVKGTIAPDGTAVDATIPDDTLLLNKILLPGYPAVPQNRSAVLNKITTTNIANENYSLRRLQTQTIQETLSELDLESSQPKGYDMADIGQIDRRVTQLEYYVSLNQLETNIKDKVIPSSISPQINRYKYGFFVDDYSNTVYTDLNSPEYYSSFEDDDVVPKMQTTTIICQNNDPITYNQFELVSQIYATSPNNAANVVMVPATAVIEKMQTSTAQIGSTSKRYLHTTNVTMSSVSGNVVIYCYMYSAADNLQVYQGNTLIMSIADSIPLTSTDVAYLKSNNTLLNPVGGGVTISNLSGFTAADMLKHVEKTTGPDTGYVAYGAKMQFTHNPALGRNYTINVSKGNGSNVWRYRMEYPVDSSNTVQTTTPNTAPITPTKFVGGMIINNAHDLYTFTQNDDNYQYYGMIDISAFGMKPNTLHKFYVQGTDHTVDCDINGSNSGGLGFSTFTTDAYGKAEIEFYYDAGEYSFSNTSANTTILLEIKSPDGSSYASYYADITDIT